jgi:hypothetical protein
MDWPCVPQGQRDAREQDYFDKTLENIKMLYLSGKVLIFLDQKYMGRFWTQYEAYLSLHNGTPEGLKPKTLEEVDGDIVFIEMGAAAASDGTVKQSLIATWRERSVAEAVAILYNPDVEVTNLSDKKNSEKVP